MQSLQHVKAHLRHPERVQCATLSLKKVTAILQAIYVCAADLAKHLSSSSLVLTAVVTLSVLHSQIDDRGAAAAYVRWPAVHIFTACHCAHGHCFT